MTSIQQAEAPQDTLDSQGQVEVEGPGSDPQVEGQGDPEATAVIELPGMEADTVVLPAAARPGPAAARPGPAPADPDVTQVLAAPATRPTGARPKNATPKNWPTGAQPARAAQPSKAQQPAEAQQPSKAQQPAEAQEPAESRQPEQAPSEPGQAPDVEATQIIRLSTTTKGRPKPDADATQIIRTPAPDATQVIGTSNHDATAVVPAAKAEDASLTALIPIVPGRKDGLRTRIAPPRDPGRAPKPAKPRREPLDLGHAPAVLTISALGVLMIALGYAGGRIGTGNASFAYWVGQVVVFTPVVVRLLSRRMAGVAESFMLVMGLALNQYLLKWMYSPDQFRFPDELQHWLATTIITQSGELFQPNPALPPAVHFPGLAEMGAGLTSMTGLPVTASGVIIAGIAHLVFVAVIFAAVLRASNSPAVAGVACATYATALHYLFFNSMFLYQTAALPYFMLAVWAVRRWRTEGGWPFAVLAVLSMGVTTVSHHVTAFAMVLTLTLLAVVELVLGRPRRWSALIMPGAALLIVATWVTTVARDVVGYLEAPADQVVHTVENLIDGTSEASSTTAAVSIGQLIVQGAGLLALFVLYLALLRDMVQRRDRDDWRWAAAVGGAIFFGGNAVRFLGQNGPEIAARLSTFTYVPISILAAIALVRGVQIIPAKDADGHRWRASPPAIDVIAPGGWNLYSRTAAGSLMITVLMIGARAGGWPPIGSILPGPYLAGGFERSVDAYGIAAADWQRDTLGHDNRVGGDVTSVSLASTYGRQDPVREVGSLYYADEWGLDQQQLVDDLAIQYLVVDRRLSEQLPEGEAYFENDPHAGSITSPLTSTQIGKFDSLAGVDRLYDNGTVRVYRMGNL